MTNQGFRDRVADLFRQRAGQWIDGLEIATIGGAYASRTRISECRTILKMDIQNRVRTLGSGRRVSEYRYVPPPPPVPVQRSLYGDEAA